MNQVRKRHSSTKEISTVRYDKKLDADASKMRPSEKVNKLNKLLAKSDITELIGK